MKSTRSGFIFRAGAMALALFAAFAFFSPARADIAPPESPPGAVIEPGKEGTQVRMVSEVVTFTMISSGDQIGQMKTQASFVMRNLGTSNENMNVRFPLTYGDALYYTDQFHEINDFRVEVNEKPTSITRVTSKLSSTGNDIPWASFQVAFPVGSDVNITATYTTMGFGYDNDPLRLYRYILETGAGWKDTIGSGDIVIQLPYIASAQNVVIRKRFGSIDISDGITYAGNEARWHFENLEPTINDNLEIGIVPLPAWKAILVERQNTNSNPKDGEAWGRLGKAIKMALLYPKGYLRDDDGTTQLYPEAVAAYESAVTLLPRDALWHYGFADLLWSHYLTFSTYDKPDYTELGRVAMELKLSQEIDPSIQSVRDLLDWLASFKPEAFAKKGDRYDFLILTATPVSVTDTATLQPIVTATTSQASLTVTPANSQEAAATPTETMIPATAQVVPAQTQPTARNPLCGSFLTAPVLVGLIWIFIKRC